MIAQLTAAGGSVHFGVDDVGRAEQILTAHRGVRSAESQANGLVVELDGAPPAGELVAALVHAGVHVDSVESSHRLEDAFLGLLAHDQP